VRITEKLVTCITLVITCHNNVSFKMISLKYNLQNFPCESTEKVCLNIYTAEHPVINTTIALTLNYKGRIL